MEAQPVEEAPERPYRPAADLIPPNPTVASLREAAKKCRACPLWLTGTQTVFGEGSEHAEIVFVGEQPGDREDRAGSPFVGPAGGVLDRALAEVGIDRDRTYVTNVVKHFKWTGKGKRRIHKTPNQSEIDACRPWFEAELALFRPRAIVCLGATAARAVIGKDFQVSRQRGEFVRSPLAPLVMATVHPSSVLRAPDDQSRREAMRAFVDDLARLSSRLRRAA